MRMLLILPSGKEFSEDAQMEESNAEGSVCIEGQGNVFTLC